LNISSLAAAEAVVDTAEVEAEAEVSAQINLDILLQVHLAN